jgi:phosphatidylglycerophosphatase A
MMQRLARWLATVAGLGDVLPAPGTTVGSLVGAAACAACLIGLPLDPLVVLLGGMAVLGPAGVWASGAEAARRQVTDPGAVVIDEVAGQWLALATVVTLRPESLSLGVVAASFLLFRVADILKPWPVSALERLPGGWGIMADDLAAGLLAAFVHLALLALP